jgi:phage tail sheath protein FI
VAIGISIQHVREVVAEDRPVRTDHTGFIGIVPQARWPNGARAGDFIELRVDSLAAFESHPTKPFFDKATRMALQSFFKNGGALATVFGLCVRDQSDLVTAARVKAVFSALLWRLRDEEEVALLAMPALAWLPAQWRNGRIEVAAHDAVVHLLQHCRQMINRFLIIDAPRGLDEEGVAAWVEEIRAEREVDPSYGAVFFPWLMNGDTALPPSGTVAGLYARVDLENQPYGVRVPPANQPLRGVTHLAVSLPWQGGRRLVDAGINPILEQPGRGLVLWGARTMSTDERWMQVTSRRIVSYVTERVRRDSEWVVFEQLRPEMWDTVARMVRSRLDAFWAAGLLTGASEGAEYEVQCDRELNPPAVVDAGQIHFKVVLRPVQATEFIEVELQLGD